MDQAKAVPLEGTADAIEPFFSPDGQWIAFSAEGKLKKVSVEGGAAPILCDAPEFRGGSWGEDGTIIATLGASQLIKVRASGGKPEPVTQFDTNRTEIIQRWPQVLPGGSAVLFTSQTRIRDYDNANIDVWSFKNGKRKTVHQGGAWARYLPAGHLIYVHQSTLFAVPFDLGRLEKVGNPTPVLEDIARNEQTGRPRLDYSLTGDMVYQTGSISQREETIQWLDSSGKLEALLAKPGLYGHPRFSPDGKRLAVSVGDYDKSDIWVYELQRDKIDKMTRLTFGGNGQYAPVWSPSGNYIIYQIGGQGIFRMKADGSGKPELLVEGRKSVDQTTYSISPDGKRLSYWKLEPGRADLMTVALDSDGAEAAGETGAFSEDGLVEIGGVFSPDGRWMAYASTNRDRSSPSGDFRTPASNG
jgi:serine/threonine-protein kinase